MVTEGAGDTVVEDVATEEAVVTTEEVTTTVGAVTITTEVDTTTTATTTTKTEEITTKSRPTKKQLFRHNSENLQLYQVSAITCII